MENSEASLSAALASLRSRLSPCLIRCGEPLK